MAWDRIPIENYPALYTAPGVMTRKSCAAPINRSNMRQGTYRVHPRINGEKEIDMRTLFFALSILFFQAAQAGQSGDEHQHAVAMPKQFETLKQLVGTW